MKFLWFLNSTIEKRRSNLIERYNQIIPRNFDYQNYCKQQVWKFLRCYEHLHRFYTYMHTYVIHTHTYDNFHGSPYFLLLHYSLSLSLSLKFSFLFLHGRDSPHPNLTAKREGEGKREEKDVWNNATKSIMKLHEHERPFLSFLFPLGMIMKDH